MSLECRAEGRKGQRKESGCDTVQTTWGGALGQAPAWLSPWRQAELEGHPSGETAWGADSGRSFAARTLCSLVGRSFPESGPGDCLFNVVVYRSLHLLTWRLWCMELLFSAGFTCKGMPKQITAQQVAQALEKTRPFLRWSVLRAMKLVRGRRAAQSIPLALDLRQCLDGHSSLFSCNFLIPDYELAKHPFREAVTINERCMIPKVSSGFWDSLS